MSATTHTEQCHADNAHGPGRCTGLVTFINGVGACARCGIAHRLVTVTTVAPNDDKPVEPVG